jgi:catechol 2,3-dioxygenase-like lactoylglutathione lyase family enzyme
MNVQLNHTIVWCRDKRESSAFLTELLELESPVTFGPMLVVALGNSVSLDYYESTDRIALQHYAFLVDDAGFERVFERVKRRGLQYWADPGKQRPGELYDHNGGRGFYFDDPNGHLLEVMTRPYDLSAYHS